jgi:cytochrome P450
LSLHPEVQDKAFAELNKVLGPGRLVTLEDRDDLPYIANLMKEVHRTHPVAPLVSHTPTEDDIYQGYAIPKGASVYANFW